MNDPKQEQPRRNGAGANENAAQQTEPANSNLLGPDGTPPADAVAEPDPFKVLEALQAENADLKDRSLRTLAEMENLRRRTEREVTDAKAYGVTSFARDMLAFADNLRRAIESVPSATRESADPALQSFVEGIELTERDFLSRLARFGVKRMEPLGKRFDPNHHEALFEIPDESVAAGMVLQIVESGYLIGERVLRPAKVGVSRGGPKGDATKSSQAGAT